MKGVAFVVVPFVALLALMLGTLVVLAPDQPAYACTSGTILPTALTPPAGSAQLTSEQWRIATTILGEGRRLGVPERGSIVAVATALQESGLRNLPYGDRDSLGLFQQRPSMGWGSPAQVAEPTYAADAFFNGGGSNSGLLDIPGWQTLPLWFAADSVQHSAFPTAYAAHEPQATAIVQAIGTGSTNCTGGSAICAPASIPVLAGLTPDAKQVVYCVVEHFGIRDLLGVGSRPSNPTSDHPSGRAVDVMIADYLTPTGRAQGDAVAAWLQTHAPELGVTYLIWNARIWSVDRVREGWRPYLHPSGATDDTSAHRNHVHVSVVGDTTTAATAPGGTSSASTPAVD